MERQLPIVAELETRRVYEEVSHENDEQLREGMHQWVQMFSEETLPRLFRSQILVTLWAIYESAVSEVAHYLRRKGKYKLKPSNFYGDKLTKYRLYFEFVLNFPLVVNESVEKDLDMLLKLRNAIAHANGRRDAVKPEDWEIFRAWENEGLGLSTDLDRLAFSEEFVKEVVAAVTKSLNDLIQRAKLVQIKR